MTLLDSQLQYPQAHTFRSFKLAKNVCEIYEEQFLVLLVFFLCVCFPSQRYQKDNKILQTIGRNY